MLRPLPLRQRMIPKHGRAGEQRKLGVPMITDRVIQAALKLVLEPIFVADLLPGRGTAFSSDRLVAACQFRP